MDTVLETYGTDHEATASSSVDNLFLFNYLDIDIVFFFFGNDIDDFSGRTVPYINVY